MKHEIIHSAAVWTIAGYFAKWYELRPNYTTDKKTWEALELMLDDKYNVSMYNSFDSFRRAKSRFLHGKFTSSRKKPEHAK